MGKTPDIQDTTEVMPDIAIEQYPESENILGRIRDAAASEIGRISVAGVAGTALLFAAIGVVGELWVQHYNPLKSFEKYFTAPPHPAPIPKVQIKEIALEPVDLSCTSFQVFDAAGSKGSAWVHGFPRTAVMESGKVVLQTCVDNNATTFEKGPVDPQTNTQTEIIKINESAIEFQAFMSEPDTLVVVTSNGIMGTTKEVLTAGASVVDTTVNGICRGVMYFFGDRCKNGLPNPADAAVEQSKKDDALVAQALRVLVTEETQQKCAAGEWDQVEQYIVDAYKKQVAAQGLDPRDISVIFVDANGKPLTQGFSPDYTKSLLEEFYKKNQLTPASANNLFKTARADVSCSMPAATAASPSPSPSPTGASQ